MGAALLSLAGFKALMISEQFLSLTHLILIVFTFLHCIYFIDASCRCARGHSASFIPYMRGLMAFRARYYTLDDDMAADASTRLDFRRSLIDTSFPAIFRIPLSLLGLVRPEIILL